MCRPVFNSNQNENTDSNLFVKELQMQVQMVHTNTFALFRFKAELREWYGSPSN